MAIEFTQLVDGVKIQKLTDSLYEATGIPTAIITNDGKVLTGSGWQRICKDFHRRHPEAEKACIESDKTIARRLSRGQKHVIYKCPHGLVDAAAPIFIDGQHMANFFTGQFLLTKPGRKEIGFFKKQAVEFGFDPDEYLNALGQTPVVPETKIGPLLHCMVHFAEIFAEMGLERKELVKLSQELRASEKRFRAFFENIPIGAVLAKPGSGPLTVNKTFSDLLGYRKEELERDSALETVERITHPEDFQKEKRAIERILSGELDGYRMEKRYIRKDGAIVVGDLTASLERGCAGEVALAMGAVIDITQRRKTEQALLEASGILNESPAVALLCKNEPGWPVEFVTENVERLLEYPSQEMISGQIPYGRIIHPEDLNRVQAEVNDFVRQGGRQRFRLKPYRIVTKTGAIKWIEDKKNIRRSPDGRITHLQGILEDITERVETEEALKQSEERFRELAELLPEVIFEMDMNGWLSFVNVNSYHLFGYTPDDLKEGINGFDMIAPEDRGKARSNALKILKGETPKLNEYKALKKDGTTFPVMMKTAPILRKGEFAGFRGFIIDMTEKVEMEARLRQAQKMEAIGTLAGGIAHDFNNILFPITGFTEMLLDDTDKSHPNRSGLDEILKAAHRARDLVRQILNFSRQADGERRPFRVQAVVREVLKLIGPSLPKTIEIRQDVTEDVGPVLADPTQIHQVIMNLITNAYHAMEGAGGVLGISLKKSESDTGRRFACLGVSDTGTGMESGIIKKIFDPYFTTKEKNKGTGLGLSVVLGIVERCGGHIEVESTPGKGSVFRVYLPVLEIDCEDRSDPPESLPHGNERILLVDDEEPIAAMEKAMLERLGYRVTMRTGSIEALEVFRANPKNFDLILTDMAMPNMPGDLLAGEIARVRPDIPVVICTGFSERLSEKNAPYIKGVLMKPVFRADLSKAVRSALEGADTRHPL